MRFSWLDQLLGSAPPANDGCPSSGSRTYRLKSNVTKAWFTASIQAQWLPGDPCPAVPMFQYLGEKGSGVTSGYSALDPAEAQDALNAFFSGVREIPEAGIQWVSARATLDVAKDDRDFAERQFAIERQIALDAASLEAAQARLTKLRDLFLSDSAMARLWWFDGERDRLLRLAENAETFDHVVSMVAETRARSAEADKIADLIQRFLTNLSRDHRELLIWQLGNVFTSYQRPELVAELPQAG